MALITCTVAVQAETATSSSSIGFEWPPVQPIAIGDPSGLDPLGPYPLLDAITSIELLSASDPVNSPENRVAQYIESRTETLRALLNTLVQLANLLPYYFVDRDGQSNVTVDNTDPENPVVTAAPSYMRADLDLGAQRIVDLADGVDANDLIRFEQLEDLDFRVSDEVEQILDTQIIRRDGSITMGADLDMDLSRVENLTPTPTDDAHAQTKLHFDSQISVVQLDYLARTGVLPMTGNLKMQNLVTDPRYKIVNVGFPTVNSDLVNLFYLNDQIGLLGLNDIPVGAVQAFFGPSANVPANFLLCDGREVSRTLYQNLFLVIGVAYGTPSSVNVFKLPDMRGRVVVGRDNMGGTPAGVLVNGQASVLGGKFGSGFHFLTVGEMPAHTHTFDDAHAASGGAGALQGATTTDSDNTVASSGRLTDETPAVQDSHNNVQPSMAVNYIIRH